MNTKLSFKQIITAGAIAAGFSMAINTILFFIFHGSGVLSDSIFIQPGQPMTIVPVLLSSIIPSLIGACIFSILLLLLSFGNPFMAIPNVTVAYGVVLNAMHVVVALSLLYFIKRAKNN